MQQITNTVSSLNHHSKFSCKKNHHIQNFYVFLSKISTYKIFCIFPAKFPNYVVYKDANSSARTPLINTFGEGTEVNYEVSREAKPGAQKQIYM
jgi:hypothetical protein